MKAWWIATAGVTLLAGALAIALFLNYEVLTPYFQGVAVESAGVLMEVLILLAAFGGYEQYSWRRGEIARLRERIEDVKHIDDPHAHGIIASAIRGLAKFGLTDIDLRGVKLTDFSFDRSDVKSLAGAVFADGMYFDRPSRNFTQLKKVNFTWLDCTGTVFGKGNLSLSRYKDCDFWGTKLRNASFEGATLMWEEANVIADEADWYEGHDEADDGSPIMVQIYNPAFDGADLDGCSFKACRLAYADFRMAKNVNKADFTGATGLETCFFDEGMRPSQGILVLAA